MNAQPQWIPETVTVTLTREDIEAYTGESDDAHNELVSRIHARGAEKTVTDIVKTALLHKGLQTRQTRTVSRKHAERALCGAIHRMYSAIHHALNAPDPEDGGDADLLDMALEAGLDAASTALELATRLDMGKVGENEPGYLECLRAWSESFNKTGDWLEVADEETDLDMAFLAAKTLLKLNEEQLADLKEKARELTEVRRLAIEIIQEDADLE